MLFDISDESDFTQDTPSLNHDDIFNDDDNTTKESLDEIINSPKTPNNNDAKNTKELDTKSKSKHKHHKTNSSPPKKVPIIDLSKFDFGAINEDLNNDEKNSNLEESQLEFKSQIENESKTEIKTEQENKIQQENKLKIEIQSPKETKTKSENSPKIFRSSSIESRISNYLDRSLSCLKSEILNEIEFIFNRTNPIKSVIDSFSANLSSEIRNEIQRLRSFYVPNSPLNISIEIDIPKSKRIHYSPFPSDLFLNQILNLKTQYSKNLAKIGNDISSFIKNRDLELSQNAKKNQQLLSKLRYLQKQSFNLELTYNELENKEKSLLQQRTVLNKKIDEFETNSYLKNMVNNDFDEIKSSLVELNSHITELNRDPISRSFFQNTKEIASIVNEISDTIQNSQRLTSSYSNLLIEMKYRIRAYNQNLRLSNFRYSAPTSTVASPKSPLFSSSPGIRNSSQTQFHQRNREASFYSPVYRRKTPNFKVISDDDDDDVMNYLLDKKFSP